MTGLGSATGAGLSAPGPPPFGWGITGTGLGTLAGVFLDLFEWRPSPSTALLSLGAGVAPLLSRRHRHS